MKTNENPKFYYAGHSFQGVRTFTENEGFYEISRQQQDKIELQETQWNWNHFYQEVGKVTDIPFDIFLMDGKFEVVPAHNGLFIWGIEHSAVYQYECMFKNKFLEMADKLDKLRVRYIELVKQMMRTFNVNEITITGQEGMLVRATFLSASMCSEIVRSIALKDGRLQFDTYNGIFAEEQLMCGIEELAAIMPVVIRNHKHETGI